MNTAYKVLADILARGSDFIAAPFSQEQYLPWLKQNNMMDEAELLEDGRIQIKPERAKELQETYDLFLGGAEAHRRIEAACLDLQNKSTEILTTELADQASLFQIQGVNFQPNATGGVVSVMILFNPGDSEFVPEPKAFHPEYLKMQDDMEVTVAEGCTAWSWCQWLGDLSSPIGTEEFKREYFADAESLGFQELVAGIDDTPDYQDELLAFCQSLIQLNPPEA